MLRPIKRRLQRHAFNRRFIGRNTSYMHRITNYDHENTLPDGTPRPSTIVVTNTCTGNNCRLCRGYVVQYTDREDVFHATAFYHEPPPRLHPNPFWPVSCPSSAPASTVPDSAALLSSPSTSTTTVDYKSVNYTEMIPVLIKAIQEQQQQIEVLKAEIERLKNN